MQLPETKKDRFATWLSEDTIDRIMIHGRREHRSKSAMGRLLIEEALDARDLADLKMKEGGTL